MTILVVEKGQYKGREFALEDGITVVGRSEDSGIPLVNDTHASRHHAEFIRKASCVVVRDLGSSNGTFINKEKLNGAQRLEIGDRIVIGRTKFVYDPMGASVVEVGDKIVTEMSQISVDEEWTASTVDAPPNLQSYEDPFQRLQTIYHYSNLMRECHSQSMLVGHILDAVFRIMSPDRAAVLLYMPESKKLEPVASRANSEDFKASAAAILVSSSVIKHCLRDRVCVVVHDAASDRRFDPDDSIGHGKIGSAICCPLLARSTVYGVLYLDTVHRIKEYSIAELELVTGIANQAALALGSVRQHQRHLEEREVRAQLDVAQRIQDKMLGHQSHVTDCLEAFGWSRPSSAIGGDFFGFFDSEVGQVIYIADSTGHGIGAALIMSMARAYLLGTMATSNLPLNKHVETLNRLLAPDMESGLYVTMLLTCFDAQARQLHYVSAGHWPPLVYRPGNDKFIELPTGGLALGILGEFTYEEAPPTDLQPGDWVVLFTDGMIEQCRSENGTDEEFGLDRMKAAIRKYVDLAPEGAVKAIVDEVDDWRDNNDQTDDYSLIMVRVKEK